MRNKSFGDFVDKKKRESIRQLRLVKQLLEHSGMKVDNFLELAYLISSSKFFIGNQSMNFSIAEQLKKKRILEVAFACPNVIPEGGEYQEVFTTKGLQYAINKFTNGRN